MPTVVFVVCFFYNNYYIINELYIFRFGVYMRDKFVVAALYQFVYLEDFSKKQVGLLNCCVLHKVKGTLLLAHEGINGTIAGDRNGIDAVLKYLHDDKRLADLTWKESYADENPFLRMKVRLKKEIVTLGVPSVDPNNTVGTYVDPKDWNELISDPDVLVLDTRNDYECDIGTFKNAVDPKTQTFREFPSYVKTKLDPKKNKKVAMFCTGGIRCEKASAYMLNEGFEQVYHLKGGILKYLETIPEVDSLWNGECFVFDQRVSVKHGLEVGDYDQCHACRYPITEDDKQHAHYTAGIACPRCYKQTTKAQKQRYAQRMLQVKLAKQQGRQHIGDQQDAKV